MSATNTFHDSRGRSFSQDSGRSGSTGRVDPGGNFPTRPDSARNHLRVVPDSEHAWQHTEPAGQHTEPAGQYVEPAGQAPLRLTRRGRLVVFGLPLVLLAALILSFGGFFNAPAKAADSVSELSVTPTVTVTVQPGESLWAIAGTVSPERDPRDVIAEIVQLNNLEAAGVQPGQQLFVPTR